MCPTLAALPYHGAPPVIPPDFPGMRAITVTCQRTTTALTGAPSGDAGPLGPLSVTNRECDRRWTTVTGRDKDGYLTAWAVHQCDKEYDHPGKHHCGNTTTNGKPCGFTITREKLRREGQ